MEYNHKNIEKKWQNIWYSGDDFKAIDFSKKPKYYLLVEFPYPSGVAMHVGHIRAYTSLEVIARKRRMEGYNVLFPIGFDAFGLPTENYAIKNHIHPRVVTDENISVFTSQLKAAGYSFDFTRVIDTTQEDYYKWTQWIFLKLFENKMAYKSRTYVNFCPTCKVVLANEESQGGKCDRCGSDVVQMDKNVWFLKISAYAEKLLTGLDKVDFLPKIRTEQENWIGKSSGAQVFFGIKDLDYKLEIYTTRPDTLFGVTFMVIAPEHELITKYEDKIQNIEEIKDYQKFAKTKTEFERIHVNKEKTGVLLKGIKAINPLNGKEVPIYVADYVMMGYGTGAIMAVPGHDERDYAFAKKFGIDIIEVIAGGNLEKEAFTDIENGTLVNSGFLNGLSVAEAKEAIVTYLTEHKIGKKTYNYKMKDWAFNRQRYWGEPIPIVYCEKCGMVPVKYEDLPIKLPKTENIVPTATGESPLANIPEFVNCTCPRCGGKAKRETDTMPQWAGSSWYFLRYIDPHNDKEFANFEKLKYWLPVDWYNGGMEHVTRHLIYSRFWHQFLYDEKVVPTSEPYKKRTAQGLILGPDGNKMSKSLGNVINPTNVIEEYGADTLRLYILFIGDYEQPTPWSENGVKGCRRFLEKVVRLFDKVDINNNEPTKSLYQTLNVSIKKVSEDLEETKYNTAISQLMILVNAMSAMDSVSKADYEVLLKLMNPITPHIASELYERLGNKDNLVFASWPKYDEAALISSEVKYVIQVNGKIRDEIVVDSDTTKEEIEEKALSTERVKGFLAGLTVVKVIVVPKKLVSIVAK